jgi:hypothetical protein
LKTVKSLFGTLAITAALAINVHAQSFLTNGLVAYYPFNGNANDASGNGNDGTVQGAALTTDRFGVANHAYKFNGTNNLIAIPDTLFGPTDLVWTVSAWIATDGGPYTGGPNWQQILGKGTQNGEMYLQVTAAGQISFGIWSASRNAFFAQSPVLSNSVLHLAGVYQRGQNVSLYINGALANTVAVPDEDLLVRTAYPEFAAIGAYNYTPSPYAGFRGTIDDVRVYRRALSASEVQQLYVYESGPRVNLIQIVQPSLSNLTLGTNYQLQVSTDLNTWTNQGAAFTATNTAMIYPQYFNVDNWNELFFRLQVAP